MRIAAAATVASIDTAHSIVELSLPIIGDGLAILLRTPGHVAHPAEAVEVPADSDALVTHRAERVLVQLPQ